MCTITGAPHGGLLALDTPPCMQLLLLGSHEREWLARRRLQGEGALAREQAGATGDEHPHANRGRCTARVVLDSLLKNT